jgi:GntP family gluconate:H+ symporter
MGASYLLILLVVTILFIVVSGAYWKWHPFFSLLMASIAFGLLAGMPLASIVTTLTSGFGTLLGAIGLIVILGSILGAALEDSGSIGRLGNALQAHSGKHPSLGIALLGMILGIPVFCDSGFIVLVSLSRSLATSTQTSLGTMNLSLAGGLYTTHTLVPPTPGPVAAAGNLGAIDSLGLLIGLGLLVSIPVVVVVYFFARYTGPQLTLQESISSHPIEQPTLPIWKPVVLLLAPVMLISIASVIQLTQPEFQLRSFLLFLGNPVIALLLTVILAFLFFRHLGKTRNIIEKGIVQSGPILLLTGCGGALGAVLKASELTDAITAITQSRSVSGVGFLLTGFVISALIKTAQGSSTSAMVVVSTILAPLALSSGFDEPFSLALLILAIGAGAMTVSHANDSYFWVISQFSGFDLKAGYRGITLMTLLQGLTALGTVLILYGLLV